MSEHDDPVHIPLDPLVALKAMLRVNPDGPYSPQPGQHWAGNGHTVLVRGRTVNTKQITFSIDGDESGALHALSDDEFHASYTWADNDENPAD